LTLPKYLNVIYGKHSKLVFSNIIQIVTGAEITIEKCFPKFGILPGALAEGNICFVIPCEMARGM